MEKIVRGIVGVCVVLLGIFLNWLMMPAWNFASAGMWGFLFLIAVIAVIAFAITEFSLDDSWVCTAISGVLCGVILLILMIGGLSSAKIFNANNYHNIIEIKDGNFNEDIPSVPEATIPIVDRGTAQKVGDRTVGGIKNSSWYEVSDEYNLIKYKGEYYRISELQYGNFFKYQKAKFFGIPGYVLVNVENQAAEYVELSEAIKYSPTAHLGEKLKRHLRREYRGFMFGKSFFEIDEEGNPYWITAVNKVTIGMFGGKKQENFVLTDAVTGDTKLYATEDLPDWVEHAYSVEYLMQVVKYHQSYVNGYWNNSELFGSKTGVNCTTYDYSGGGFAGYNTAITKDDEIVFYTGVTPASGAESNLGFILASPRTGEVKYYDCVGAEESSAQLAAQGLVQNLGYVATFPTIINVEGEETYFMLLKDAAGLVQRYAFCSVENYTKVVEAKTFDEALSLYRGEVNIEAPTVEETKSKVGIISSLYQAEIAGYTYFYFTLEDSDMLYMSSIENSNKQVMLEVGTKVSLNYAESSEAGVCVVHKITF